MAQEHPRLKLGKRAAFVKTHLKRLPRQEETWAVDFRALPKPAGQTDTHYLGLAVALPRGDPLVYLPVEYTPTVNDLADLLAEAMRRPLTGSARRPEHLHFRANPRWEELFHHLKELGVEVTLRETFRNWKKCIWISSGRCGRPAPAPSSCSRPGPPTLAGSSPPSTNGFGRAAGSRSGSGRKPGSWPVRWTTPGWCSRTTAAPRWPRRWPLWRRGWPGG